MPVLSKAGDEPTGPIQKGSSVRGQYVYWISMVHLTDEVQARHNFRQPFEFDRQHFSGLIVSAHKDCEIEVVETAVFREPYANSTFHLNCLTRASKQFRWKKPAERLRHEHRVLVYYGTNIKSLRGRSLPHSGERTQARRDAGQPRESVSMSAAT